MTSFPDAGNVEDYTEEEFHRLLEAFAKDKASLTKKQQAAVARYNFKKGKGDPIVFKGQAPAAGAPAAPATPGNVAADRPGSPPSTVQVSEDIVKLLPPDMQALAGKDPATLTKDEKIALAKAKSQAVKAAQAAKDAQQTTKEEGPKGPSPEEVARQKALEHPHAARLDARFREAIESWSMQVYAPVATVKAEKVLDVVRWLHDELGFDYLRNLTATDYPPERIEVVYNLFNMQKRQHLALRASVPRVAPEGQDLPALPSVVSVHKGADWLEREVYDLFGIRFRGHPYMRRLMLPDGWVGFPLRKDYDLKREQFVGLKADGTDLVSFDSKDGW